MTIGEKLIYLREANQYSQKQLAEKLQVSTGVIAEWESNETIPTIPQIIHICSIFGVTTDTLLMDDHKLCQGNQELKSVTTNKWRQQFSKALIASIIGIVIITLGVIAFLIPYINHNFTNKNGKNDTVAQNVTPKLDKEGNPIFIEFNTEVYANTEKYLGYHVQIQGQIFQVLDDIGSEKQILIWAEANMHEMNTMIYFTSDADIKKDDYISCTGYIKSIITYKNAYGAEISVPLICSSDLKQSTYIDVISPTLKTINCENLKYTDYGYNLQVTKVEYAQTETRIYITVTNNGKESLYVSTSGATIIQNGIQYNQQSNFVANYEEIPYTIIPGAYASGIITFSNLELSDFTFSINLHTSNSNEKMGQIKFLIGNECYIELPQYPSVIGIWEHQGANFLERLTFSSNGTFYLEYINNTHYSDPNNSTPWGPTTGTWTQFKDELTFNVNGSGWNNPFYAIVGETEMHFWGDWYERIEY